jgi:hypothetical protein
MRFRSSRFYTALVLIALAFPALGEEVTLVCTDRRGVDVVFIIDFEKHTAKIRPADPENISYPTKELSAQILPDKILVDWEDATGTIVFREAIDRVTGKYAQWISRDHGTTFQFSSDGGIRCQKRERQF